VQHSRAPDPEEAPAEADPAEEPPARPARGRDRSRGSTRAGLHRPASDSPSGSGPCSRRRARGSACCRPSAPRPTRSKRSWT